MNKMNTENELKDLEIAYKEAKAASNVAMIKSAVAHYTNQDNEVIDAHIAVYEAAYKARDKAWENLESARKAAYNNFVAE